MVSSFIDKVDDALHGFFCPETGRLRLNEQLNVSSHAAQQPTSKLGLRTWENISAEDAILAVITRSANDAAVVLAERLGGSESQFAIKMTSTAHDLGMYGSHFMNATGLPNDWQTTTAHDMAVLALKIIRDFPQYYPYFAVDNVYINGRALRSTNKFVAHYPGAEGMKTGYTCGSGFNLVATANQNGKRLIGVVLGGMTSSQRYEHMFTMMDIGFSDEYGTYRTKNINTMGNSAIGTPPYQLSCGRRPTTHYAARQLEINDDDDHAVHYVRKASRSRHVVANSRAVVSRVTKIRIAGKTKTIVKRDEPQRLARSAKNVRNTSSKIAKAESKVKVVSTSRKGGKNVSVAVAKSKTVVRSKQATQTAKASTRSKGYYVPGKEKSLGKSAKSKGKGYFKGDSSNKMLARVSDKGKHGARKKS